MTNQDFQQDKSILDMFESSICFYWCLFCSQDFPKLFISISIFLLSLFKCILQFAKSENAGWHPKTARGLFTPRYQFLFQNVYYTLALYFCRITAVLEPPHLKDTINPVYGSHCFFLIKEILKQNCNFFERICDTTDFK